MNYQREREDFFMRLGRALNDKAPHEIREIGDALCRASTTLTRLATAQCNGDYPADNGERKVEWCPRCQRGWTRSEFAHAIIAGENDGKPQRVCRDCRTEENIKARVAPFGLTIVTQGDPRGCVLRVLLPGQTRESDALCVPSSF